MSKENRQSSSEEILRLVKESRKAAHQRLAERQERVTKVIERTDRIQDNLRRHTGG